MGKVTGSWERQIQGVSQQADKDRINGQCSLQENMIPSPLAGLVKRIGTRHISQLFTSSDSKALWYIYLRGDEETYLVNIEPNANPRVFDLLGNEKVVNVSTSDETYHKVADPKGSLKLHTIADYTFVLNKDRVVTISPDVAPKNPATAIVYCQYANYGRDYIIKLNDVEVARYATKSGEVATDITDVKTNNIIEKLAPQVQGRIPSKATGIAFNEPVTGKRGINAPADIDFSEANPVRGGFNKTKGVTLVQADITVSSSPLVAVFNKDVDVGDEVELTYVAVGAAPSEYSVEVNSNTMFITRIDGATFTIETVDGAAGNDLVAVQDTVQQLSNLPPYAPVGYTVKVQNKQGFTANSYWLKASVEEDGEQTGSTVRWIEAVAPDSKYKFNLATMPISLISEADGTFTLQDGEWEDRKVGNDETNPFPSFVDNKISGLGVFQNRMMFTSNEAAVFGRTNNFFSLFRETTQTESPSDPVDGYADSDEINNLRHHSVLDGDVVFFAENGQFLVKGDNPLTKDNLTFKRVTSYPVNVKCKPAVTGESVMFSFSAGKYSGIREMFTDSITDTKKARPITEHVSEYIRGLPVDMIASPNINTMFIRTDEDKDTLYVYDWLWVGEQKAQSAFHKWIFNADVLHCKFIGDTLYLVMDRGDSIYLEELPVGNDADDNGLDFAVLLDRRKAVTSSWSEANQRWEWTPPYPVVGTVTIEAVRGEGCWEEDRGTSVILETDGTTYWTYDDLADTSVGSVTLTVGEVFTSKYVPTQPYIKDQNGRVIGLDRFTLGAVSINYESTGDLEVLVTDKYSQGRFWKYEHNGRRIGAWNNKVGFAPLTAGKFKFPIRLPSDQARIEIRSNDYRPLIIRSMEWEGMFKQRGQRL